MLEASYSGRPTESPEGGLRKPNLSKQKKYNRPYTMEPSFVFRLLIAMGK
jgi:hypothetical protein